MHAARIGTVAVVLTAVARVAEVEIGLPPSELGTAQTLDQTAPSPGPLPDPGSIGARLRSASVDPH